jgi:Protein of unknown function (DUF1778)
MGGVASFPPIRGRATYHKSAMATTSEIETGLKEVARRQAELAAEIERLKQAVAEAREDPTERDGLSPSRPVDAPHPSAALVISDEAYDALIERLDAPPKPYERLRRTMSLHPLPKE